METGVNHRTYGETKNCKGCRFWSEMVAMVDNGAVVALCLAKDGPHSSKYTRAGTHCAFWKSGHHGAVDEPPDYGAETRALYQREEAAQ
jgi:hypothetical protein